MSVARRCRVTTTCFAPDIRPPSGEFGYRPLVEAAGIEIVVADDQPFSFAELEERKGRVHKALLANGFRDVVTNVNIQGGGVIPVTLTPEPGLAATAEAILALLPPDLKSSVELTISDAPVVVREGAFGGMWMLRSGIRDCTSGWTVQKVGSSTRGVSTAGHCNSINQIEHPGHAIHAAITQAPEHQGQWGDVQWHTTTFIEADDFYANSTIIRDVVAVEPRAGISQNEAICAYGRSSNVRHCSLAVLDVSTGCGGGVDRLVQMNGDTQTGGDSGGGWSMNHTAFGGHVGNCGGLDTFSVADLFDEAIGVVVATN